MGAFAALYPKGGEVFVVNGAPGPSYPPNTPGTTGSYRSELRQRDGTLIPNSGIEQHDAMTPVFSHDGAMLAFNDRSPTTSGGHRPGKLALYDYEAATHEFSNYRELVVPNPDRHVAWPAFTPDNKLIIYQHGVGEDLNFEPTLAPVASGGYFWMIFTSRRTYVQSPYWQSRGDECCNGFCRPEGEPPTYVCAPPDGGCSNELEVCTTSADCCDPSLRCIAGRCSVLPPK